MREKSSKLLGVLGLCPPHTPSFSCPKIILYIANQKHTRTAWLLNDCSSFICSTTYLLLQDTIPFCPTPSDVSTSQTLTQIPHSRIFLFHSHATAPLLCNCPPCTRLPHSPQRRQWYHTSPLSTVPPAPHPPLFILLMHEVKLGMTVPGRTLAFHGLHLAHRLTTEEPCAAVWCPLCGLLSKGE